MVDVTQIPYNLASTAVRGVYDSAIDGASDLVDATLESAQNSLTISTQLLNNTISSAYTEVVKIPDVISDVLFGISNIPSKALDAASRAGRYVWDNIIPDIPGIDVEETVRSLLAGAYEFLFGSEEQQPLVTLQPPTDVFVGDEEITQKVVVAGIDSAGTEAARVKITRLIIVQPGSLSSSAVTAPTSLSTSTPSTTKTESGSSVVIASIPLSTGEVAVASAAATVADETPVVVAVPEGSTTGDTGGVEVSEGESSPSVFQTILNFLTGTTTDSSNVSNNVPSTAATAQTAGLGVLLGTGGNSGVASSGARSSSTVVPTYNVLPPAVSRVFGDSGGPLTLGEAIYRVLTGAVDSSEVVSQTSTGLSTTRTLFYATVSRALGSNGNSTSSNQDLSLGSSIPQVVVAAGLNNIADISYVPYSGNISSRISLADSSSSNLETGEVASNLTDGVYGLHLPTDANSDSGSQEGEQNAYETMRDLELAQSLNNPSLDGPSVVINPSFLINQSRQVSVAV